VVKATAIDELIFTMIIMQGETTANRQLTLDFSEGFVVREPLSAPRNVTRTIVFPKHIVIQNFGRFEQQVNLLFAPLGISVEFRLTRQNRLEMKWIFPPEANLLPLSGIQKQIPFDKAVGELSTEEIKAFKSVVYALAETN
tara:strand:+ start:107 stop:529 length:423 start_codon:yes stop_codon:yes gene_type:complete